MAPIINTSGPFFVDEKVGPVNIDDNDAYGYGRPRTFSHVGFAFFRSVLVSQCVYSSLNFTDTIQNAHLPSMTTSIRDDAECPTTRRSLHHGVS